MKTADIKKAFIECVYDGNKVQFEWACFIDSLCKSGEITQKQYDNATF